ncbi:hypothetical protein AB0B88_16035 [Micromonospora haikouensis]|uniref:hypothetical protein n=1 Tax=Actinomycetes TaxID=1760 RepID=UPI0033CCE44E
MNAATATLARMEQATTIREMAAIWDELTIVDSLNDLVHPAPGIYATTHDIVAVYGDGRRADVADIPLGLSERAMLLLKAMRAQQAEDAEDAERGRGRPYIGPRVSARVQPEQSRAIRAYAKREGIPQAEAVRRLLDRALEQVAPQS